jgi:hypothetical protein
VVPGAITTSSPRTGTEFPPQVAVEFQFPETVEVLVAAKTDSGKNIPIDTKTRVNLIMIIPSEQNIFLSHLTTNNHINPFLIIVKNGYFINYFY